MRRTGCLLLVAVAACTVDAPTYVTPDAPPIVCLAGAYGAAALDQQRAETVDGKEMYVGLRGHLNAERLYDEFYLGLFQGHGVMTDGIMPGTYAITGDETNYGTCGLCVLVFPDTDSDGAVTTLPYLARSGTVTITSVTPDLVGSVSDIELIHVQIDDNFVSTPHPDGCTASIASAAFSAPIM